MSIAEQEPRSRIALVTGSSSGIGRSSAIALNAAGWTVILTGRRKDALEETVRLMGDDRSERTTIVVGDLAKPEFVEALFDIIRRDFGRLDLLFNNAGMGAPKQSFDRIPLDTFQEVLDLNVTSAFFCAQEAFKLMREQEPQGGRIINNGSISAYAPRPLGAAYTISKHAISGLTKSIALEGREHNIACSQIDIGNAYTSLSSSGSGQLQADGTTRVEAGFDVKHVGDALVYMAELPLEVNILSQTIMATTMPFVGRG
ncbi:short-chain dehydrogenase/reductase SDR [Kockovaella imperatae]|uniref:Short-chain dehydrogenase/reductase SDR n=1 Tax=Kockovaella imperatae TaxID=4999 RepID=A0A1Y1ULR4_9TREE|nr:short-chain dehydrogenase/reductase SDR [Kockovaella imperatae]ORX38988.1 short-chain dehydrogenase/reductase SDR [Kockovaella imperatae]